MADLSTVKSLEETIQVTLFGPALEQFPSLSSLAIHYLDTYWKHWRNYEEPKGYLIPPVFRYKNPEVSDEAFEEFKRYRQGQSKVHAVIANRRADEAEHIVYKALDCLASNGVHSPFLALWRLDLFLNLHKDGLLQGRLTKLFPKFDWQQFHRLLKAPNAELDFLVISPKIGVVIIEVKASSYEGDEKNFANGKSRIPTGYRKGLAQLEAAGAFSYFLEQCSGIHAGNNGLPITKILFTPNLERQRYSRWLKSLPEAEQVRLNSKTNRVIQWFKEDLTNIKEEGDKPLLYSTLRTVLETSGSMTPESYEACAPIAVATAALVVLPQFAETATGESIQLTPFMETHSIMKESREIIYQNPLFRHKKSKISCCVQLSKAPKLGRTPAAGTTRPDTFGPGTKSKPSVLPSKIFLLSADQLRALCGPNRQMVVGAGGTGKTLVLQTKAVELLNRGCTVSVLAPCSYAAHYTELFEFYGFAKDTYKVESWSSIIVRLTDQLSAIIRGYMPHVGSKQSSEFSALLFQYIEKHEKALAEKFHDIFSFDGLLIDDAFDDPTLWYLRFLLAPTFFMTLAYISFPTKIVWAAIDPYAKAGIRLPTPHTNYRNRNYENALLELMRPSENLESPICFSSVTLRQVMRCSQSIFERAYASNMELWPEVLPTLGHKIQGSQSVMVEETYTTFRKARKALWRHTDKRLRQLLEQNLDITNIAVLVCASGESNHSVCVYLKKQFRKRWPAPLPDLQCLDPTTSDQVLAPPDWTRLTIADWYAVSSLEWPVVICVSCLPSVLRELQLQNVAYQRYRATSRAMVKLTEITVTYDDTIEDIEELVDWLVCSRMTSNGY